MKYRVFFTTGETLIISEERYKRLTDNPTHQFCDDFINLTHTTHIIPEQDSPSGIASSPTPDDLRGQKRKKEEAIKADSKQVLERAKKKYDEE